MSPKFAWTAVLAFASIPWGLGSSSATADAGHRLRIDLAHLNTVTGPIIGVVVVVLLFLGVLAYCCSRSSKIRARPNTVVGEIASIEGIQKSVSESDRMCLYVVVSFNQEPIHVTKIAFANRSRISFNEKFQWAMNASDVMRLRKPTGYKFRFEIYDMRGSTYADNDEQLLSKEIPAADVMNAYYGSSSPSSSLLSSKKSVSSAGGASSKSGSSGSSSGMLSMLIETRQGWTLHAKVGFSVAGSFEQQLLRFKQAWKVLSMQLSFWTRILCLALSISMCAIGVELMCQSVGTFAAGVSDVITGTLLGLMVLPHVLRWVGISVLDKLLYSESLMAMWSFCFSSVATGLTIYHIAGDGSVLTHKSHIALLICLGFAGLLFLISDIRQEPGSSLVGTFLSCCFPCFIRKSRLMSV